MATKIIKLPKDLDLHGAMQFSMDVNSVEQADEYVLDFGDVETSEPFGMLIISSELQRLVAKYPGASGSCANFQKMTYAGNMGFFKAFGLNHGMAPGEADGGNNFVPITIFDCNQLRSEAASEGLYVGEVIEKESQHLAEMLCGESSGEIHSTLSYSLREIMRNVVEHSEASRFGICAQNWTSKKMVEVAIIDRGVGLKATLSRNPHLEIPDCKAAINYALMPAVSGRVFKGAKVKNKNQWTNSGFGLYMTSRICRNGGTFFVASGDVGMLLTKRSEGKRYIPCSFEGTAVRMVIKTDQIESLKKALDVYRAEGFEIQKTYKEIVSINPSAASLMLSEDFDLSVWQRLREMVLGKK